MYSKLALVTFLDAGAVDPGFGGGLPAYGGGHPSTGPVYPPGHPSAGLPIQPGHPSGGFPVGPGHPSGGFPVGPGHPDAGLPPVPGVVWPPRNLHPWLPGHGEKPIKPPTAGTKPIEPEQGLPAGSSLVLVYNAESGWQGAVVDQSGTSKPIAPAEPKQ